MPDEIYYRLRERLDQYTIGFGATESEVEIKILERLFTVEEAEMYLSLTGELQSAKAIAEQINRDPEEVEEILKCMTEKGYVYARFPKEEGESMYFAAAPWAHGIFELTAGRIDEKLADLIDQYFKSGPFKKHSRHLQRTIPVNKAVEAAQIIAPYDDVKAIIRSKKLIAIGNCSCADLRHKLGETCNKPKEVCMTFDFYAQHYIGMGKSRQITQDEALAILDECQENGLIAQIGNGENPEVVCNCCPECCMGFMVLKNSPKPGLVAESNYYSQVDAEKCIACEICVDRCPTDAITIGSSDFAEVNLERCVGCGLCATGCQEGAITLRLKLPEHRKVPPLRNITILRSSEEMEASIKA